MTLVRKLARYLGRQPWLPTVGPRLVTMDIGLQRLTGDERTAAWTTATHTWPAYNDYATRSGREIRIFRATRH